MANPGPKKRSSYLQRTNQEVSQARVDTIAEQLAFGHHPREIAAVLHPGDPRSQRATRREIERLVRMDPRIYKQVLDHARVDLASGVGPSLRGLIRRARGGNPQAARLVLEIAGVHNPRVKHEHKGDIKIKLEGLPRPQFERTGIDDQVVDADVVE